MKRIALLSVAIIFSAESVRSEIVIVGSDVLGAKLMPKLVECYAAHSPQAKFTISANGTNDCFSKLLTNECHIGMASRPQNDDERAQFSEKNIALKQQIIGFSMMAIVIHKSQPISNISLQNLGKIYTGEIVNWHALGGSGKITAYQKNSSSEIYKSFQQLAMNGKPYGKLIRPDYEWHSSPTATRNDQVGTIAYVTLPFTPSKEVKQISVNGLNPCRDNLSKYPLIRELRLFFRDDAPKEAKEFVHWICTSEEAFAITELAGFFPIHASDPLRSEKIGDDP
jgi:phosphate transport system substrate-binding protein